VAEATGPLPQITVVDRTAGPLRVMTVARWGDQRLPMAGVVDPWAAPCRPMVVAVARWAPTVAAGLPPIAELAVGAQAALVVEVEATRLLRAEAVAAQAALVEEVEATRLLRAEAVVTTAVVAEVDTDTADSILFLIAGKSNAAQISGGVLFWRCVWEPERFRADVREKAQSPTTGYPHVGGLEMHAVGSGCSRFLAGLPVMCPRPKHGDPSVRYPRHLGQTRNPFPGR